MAGNYGDLYPELIAAIKDLADGWWNRLDPTWIVTSNLDHVAICDTPRPHIDSSEELLVAGLTGLEATTAGYDRRGRGALRRAADLLDVPYGMANRGCAY